MSSKNMCKDEGKEHKGKKTSSQYEYHSLQDVAPNRHSEVPMELRRRGKRDKQALLPCEKYETIRISRFSTALSKKHGNDSKSGGIEAILPSFAIVIILAFAYTAKSGFRGRSTVAGIDLGTTNSVICVQQQAKGVGNIECIPDPFNESPIIPSVVSFVDPHRSRMKINKDDKSNLNPHPIHTLVGAAAKARIDSHPHHTLYHAKRIIGRPFHDDSVKDLSKEVEFEIAKSGEEVVFRVPFHSDKNEGESSQSITIPPHRVGSYVVNHLMNIARSFLGHDNLNSAVIAVPAKFNQNQRIATMQAFKDAGVKIARVIEEPVAAALAYGLQKKANVDFILVYDFGGGTLDVSVLQVFDGGYVEVIGNDGDNSLGGADFDAVVAHHLMEADGNRGRYAVATVNEAIEHIQSILEGNQEFRDEDMEEILSRHCEKLKMTPLCTISSFHTIGEHMKIFLSSSNNETAKSSCFSLSPHRSNHKLRSIPEFCEALEKTVYTISRIDYENACKGLFDKSIVPVNRLLTDLNLKAEDIDEVVMVGGTTKMPQIREIIKSAIGSAKMNVSIDPDLTVAFGAASVVD